MSGAAETPGGAALIEGRGLSLSLGRREVLDKVDVTVNSGEIVTLVGPNGAGKTTLVRVLLGILTPDAGRVTRRAGLKIGYVPQRLQVDPVLPITVRRFLALAGKKAADNQDQVLTEVGASNVADAMVHALSGGEFQRVLLARSLLRTPELMILDEPVSGVDIGGQFGLYDLITRIRD